MPKFTALASELQLLTRVGDDETLSLASTLLNFGVAPEKIEPAIRGTIGLATAMRMDLGSAAQNLALAYEGQFTMLARYIPALRTATTDAEKMAIVQGVMARGFEQAQAASGTLAGRWDQLKNRVGDLWEKIGQTVAEALNLSGAFEKAERAVNSLIDSAVFDKIATGLRSAVSYVIVQVKTAADLISHLRSQDFGMTRMAEVGKTIVVELVTMAVTLLMALIKSQISVLITIVKVVAAVFKKELLDVVRMIPGLRGKVADMALDKAESLDYNKTEEMAKSLGFKSSQEMYGSDKFKSGNLDSSIAAYESTSGIADEIKKTSEKIKDTLKDVDAQWEKSKGSIKASAGVASGGGFNWDAAAAGNKTELDTFLGKTSAPAGPEPKDPMWEKAKLEREKQELAAKLAELQRQENDVKSRAGQSVSTAAAASSQFSQWQSREGKRNYSPRSHEYQTGQSLAAAARSSQSDADKAAAEAAQTLASLAGMISQFSTRLKDVEGQIRNAP
jgi:hypothetical protein